MIPLSPLRIKISHYQFFTNACFTCNPLPFLRKSRYIPLDRLLPFQVKQALPGDLFCPSSDSAMTFRPQRSCSSHVSISLPEYWKSKVTNPVLRSCLIRIIGDSAGSLVAYDWKTAVDRPFLTFTSQIPADLAVVND